LTSSNNYTKKESSMDLFREKDCPLLLTTKQVARVLNMPTRATR
jgi:hypothetical protein